MINKAILEGRIVRDIELRKTASGKSYTSFTLAVNRTYKQEGQRMQILSPVWHGERMLMF